MAEAKSLSVLVAPAGQLSEDGQLRESVSERRERKGGDFPLWYLSTELVKKFKLSGEHVEAVVAEDPSVITWLNLRFGGTVRTAELDVDKLRELAMDLPPKATNKDISN